jgi:hypothetical protein
MINENDKTLRSLWLNVLRLREHANRSMADNDAFFKAVSEHHKKVLEIQKTKPCVPYKRHYEKG